MPRRNARIRQARAYSAFGEATYSVTSAFRLTGGLRYTSETKDQTGTALVQTFVVPAGPFAPPTPLPPFAQNFNYTINGHLKNDNVSGRASVEFDASAHNLLYATYSTGFKSGGFNPDSAPNTYRPEKLIAYTLGSKNRFLDDKLQLNLEGFYWDYRNHQENVLSSLNANPLAFAPFTRNIGKSTVKGVNVEMLAKLSKQDLFTANVEYLDGKFNDFRYVVPTQVAPVPGIQTTCAETPLAPPPRSIAAASRLPAHRNGPRWSAISTVSIWAATARSGPAWMRK